MKITEEIKSYGSLCGIQCGAINNIDIDESDFVDKYDHSPETAEDYACGNMQADIILPTEEVLKKYNITVDEYREVAEKISEEVSFGSCGWCV